MDILGGNMIKKYVESLGFKYDSNIVEIPMGLLNGVFEINNSHTSTFISRFDCKNKNSLTIVEPDGAVVS
jgi:hypothetical protein